MLIVWDEPKRQRNLAKHGLDFADLTTTFFENARVEPAKQDRFLALGELAGVPIVAVVFRPHATGKQDRKEPCMTTNKWPSFITRDLGPDDDAEMMRRWEAYDRDMKALIATGAFHQDEDGWWVETATGDLVGPDPEIERPLTFSELAGMKPFAEAFPDLAESIKRSRGRPAKDHPKTAVTLRIDPRVVAQYQADGADWRARMAEALERAVSRR